MKPRITSIVTALMLLLADHAWAGTPTERLRAFFDEANAIIHTADPERGPDEPRGAILVLANDVFDFREAAALALGREWPARTPQEQEEFVRLFADLLERRYVAMVGSKARVSGGGFAINFVGESVQGDAATVTTTMLTRSGNELPVDYRMGRRGGQWAVQDVTIDGVSLVGNYRAQVHRVMQASSYGDLVAQIRNKLSDSPQAATPAQTGHVQPVPIRMVAADDPPVPVGVLPTPAAETATPTARPLAPGPSPAPATVAPAPPATPFEQPAATQPQPPPALAPAAEPHPTAQQRLVPHDPTPSAERRKPVAPRASYWVQLGAFKSADAAARLAQQISTASTRVTALHPDSLVRVRVGPFAQWAQAVVKLKELEKRGYHGFVVAETRD